MEARRQERGAVALEMAILLPLLLLLLVGVIEYGRVFNVQISLTHAAREGARHAAIHFDDGDFENADVAEVALNSAPALDGLPVEILHNADACPGSGTVRVTASLDLGSLSGILESESDLFAGLGLFPIPLEGVGVMRCRG